MDGTGSRAVTFEGWEIEFWPVIIVALARPAEMWCVKFVFIAGTTLVWDGTEQIELRR